MAILKPSIVGKFNGKIGEAVLTTWKDLYVGRSLPTKSKKAPSDAQKDQRMKFGLVTGFFGSIANVIAIGYQSASGSKTAVNAAVQAHLKTMITGVYPAYTLDYTKAVLSAPRKSGDAIDGGFSYTTAAIAGSKLTISWLDDKESDGSALTSETDLVNLVFYSPATDRFVIILQKAVRSALTTTVTLPRAFAGDKLHGYVFFVSPDGKAVSYSSYLGQFTMLA